MAEKAGDTVPGWDISLPFAWDVPANANKEAVIKLALAIFVIRAFTLPIRIESAPFVRLIVEKFILVLFLAGFTHKAPFRV